MSIESVQSPVAGGAFEPGAARSAPPPAGIPAAALASRVMLTLAIALVLLLSIYLIRFASPLADDFYRAWDPRAHGLLSSFAKEYRLLSGRWLSTGLNYTNGRFFNLYSSYPLVLLASLLGLFAGMYLLIGSILPGLTRAKRLATAAAFLAFYWSREPQPGQTCYWLTGSLENQLSLGFLMAAASVLLRAPAGRRPSLGRLLAVAVSFFIAMGGHELYGAMTLLPVMVGAAIAWWRRRPERAAWIGAVIAAVIGIAVVAAAPGNRRRGSQYPHHGQLLTTVRVGTEEAAADLARWSTDGGLWLATALILLMGSTVPRHPQWLFDWLDHHTVVLPAVWAAILAAGFYIPAWALGNTIPPRTVNSIYCFFLIGWFLFALQVARPYQAGLARWLRAPSPRSVLLACFALALLLGPNVLKGVIDAASRGPRYLRASNQRRQLAEAAVAARHLDLALPPIRTWPNLAFQDDLSPDPRNWRNTGFAIYFGLHSVVLQRPDSRVVFDTSGARH